ncbi:MAG: hypothetical protein KGH58_00805 [Candidatus Micrarchaeota archaeon]|nr:hypothetical protein [Candidatus Micrarchaeota archaeon]
MKTFSTQQTVNISEKVRNELVAAAEKHCQQAVTLVERGSYGDIIKARRHLSDSEKLLSAAGDERAKVVRSMNAGLEPLEKKALMVQLRKIGEA